MRRLISALTLFLLYKTASAQQPLQFYFTHYTTSSGLISNQVNTVIQDNDGFIWTGTTDGLQRFDGIRYKTFQHKENDSLSIPANPVWQLVLDKKNNLWVLLANGKVGFFDTRQFTFHEVPCKFKKPISPNTYLKRLIADEYGNVFYLIGGSEVITWDEKNGDFSYTHNFFRYKEEWPVVDFIQQPGTRKYWMSIERGGLAVYNFSTGQVSYPGYNIEKESLVEEFKSQETYSHLFFDLKNRFWAERTDLLPNVVCFDLQNNKPVLHKTGQNIDLKANQDIKYFFQQHDGSVWINGPMLFAKFSETENKFQFVYNGYQSEKSIAYELTHCLYEDRENNIWVGTDNNGLYRFNPSMEFFINIGHLNNATGKKGEASPRSFINTKSGNLFAATWGDGIYQYDKNLDLIPGIIKGLDYKKSQYVSDMFLSGTKDTIWMATREGIYAYNASGMNGKFYRPAVLENMTVNKLAQDKQGNLWLGMENTGVYKWNAEKGKADFDKGLETFTAIPQVGVNKITVDSKGYLWIATPENGVYVINPETDKIAMHFGYNEDYPYKLPENGASSILDYDDSLMIITTATRIFKYNRIANESSTISTPQSISGFNAALERDKMGFLWLTSSNGLYRFNFQKKVLIIFNKSDGLDNEHFKQSSSLKMNDGRLLFGTTNHFVAFDPNKSMPVPKFPDTRITDIKITNRSLPLDSLLRLKEIELGYQDNSIEIEFSSLMYNTTFPIKYKMEGLDKDWKIADKNNQAIYSYLPAGHYTFKLKTLDAEGSEASRVTELKINVIPPFWKTIWFYCMLVLVAGGFLYWLDRERMARKEALQNMRTDIADNLHEEVSIALNNINILSEVANLKVSREPEKSKEYIEQIHSKSQNIMIAMDDMLWSIKPENDSMAKIIDRLTEHIEAIKNRFGVKMNLLVDKKVLALKINMKLRKNLLFLFKGGSANIVRCGADDCNIHISLQKQNLLYTLEFNSMQLDIQQMNNLLQRQELVNKLKEVNGLLSSKINNSRSEIELTIPVS